MTHITTEVVDVDQLSSVGKVMPTVMLGGDPNRALNILVQQSEQKVTVSVQMRGLMRTNGWVYNYIGTADNRIVVHWQRRFTRHEGERNGWQFDDCNIVHNARVQQMPMTCACREISQCHWPTYWSAPHADISDCTLCICARPTVNFHSPKNAMSKLCKRVIHK
jgi:hypothetical protein